MPDFDPIDPRDIAALVAMRRLSLGAAHSLNNAFAAALGEASYLLDERKDDDEIVEGCQIILEALERSVRITRGLLACPDGAGSEADAAGVLRQLEPLLGETLGRSHPLRIALPDEWVAVPTSAADLDLLFTTLIQHAADASGELSTLDGTLDVSDGDARFSLHVRSESLNGEAPAAVNDPDRATTPLLRSCLVNARRTVDAMGGSLHADQTSPDEWSLVLRLPTLP